ncbi:MAG: phosphate acyltransferase PlsX [Phycisphaerales bacterium JB059]
MRLAVDVMGGDDAPDAVLKGCVESLKLLGPDDRLVLVGPEDLISDHLSELSAPSDKIEIEHAPDVIAMHDAPAASVRSKRNSSIVRLAKLGSGKVDNPCDAVFSAGNTGACVSAGIMHMKRLPGVHRPGIAVTIPAFHGPVILCDAGANPEPKPTHLWQYAVMADVVARDTLRMDAPRVAVMNIGAEEGKGSELVKGAAELIKATPDLNYIGFIEGRDFFAGAADVIITDGFTGNTILKTAEGLAKSLFQALATEIFEHDPNLALQFEPIVKSIYAKNDYHEHGGAPLLGVNGVMTIGHGSSKPRSIAAAIRNTRDYVAHGVNERIAQRIQEVASVEHQREHA